MSYKLKIPKEVIDFIDNTGNYYKDGSIEDNEYYNLPFWYKKTEEEGVYEVFKLDELPEEVRIELKEFDKPLP